MEENTPLTTTEETSPNYPKLLMLSPFFLGVLLTILIVTNEPGRGGPAVILIFLLLVFLLTLSSSANIFVLLSRYFKLKPFSIIRLLYTSVAIAAGTVFLIGLQTLGQLQLIDLILIIAFELLLNFYLLRRF